MKIDLCFQVIGKTIPVDHSFALYGGISRLLPAFHEDSESAIKPIRGRYCGQGTLDISPMSELVIRIPSEKTATYMNIAGKTINISGHTINIGIPHTRMIKPYEELFAFSVTTRNGQDTARFKQEINRQLQSLGVNKEFTIHRRKTFCIHKKQIVAYEVSISNLNDEESILLQENGVGGRRKIGCGFFERKSK